MTMTVLKKSISAAGMALLTNGAAMAEIVTFNEFGRPFQGSGFTSGGLAFAGTSGLEGVWTAGPTNGYANNFTPYLLDGFGSQLTITRSNLAAFTLDSFEMALGWDQSVRSASINVTYALAAGGTSSSMLALTDRYATFSPGLAIFKATFDLTGAPDGYISMDNISINVTAVPEPDTYALLIAGMVAVAGIARRHRQ